MSIYIDVAALDIKHVSLWTRSFGPVIHNQYLCRV